MSKEADSRARLLMTLSRYSLDDTPHEGSQYAIRPASPTEVDGEEDVAEALTEALRTHMGDSKKKRKVAIREVDR